MRLLVEKGRYPAEAARYFDFARLDAFHGPAMLGALWGDAWHGVLIADGRRAWLHAAGRRAIRDTGCFDVEPLLGYAGPVATTAEPAFLEAAWAAYADLCRRERVVAELFRFHPVLQNHAGAPPAQVRLLGTKKIVRVRCHDDEERQLAEYSPACARRVRVGLRGLQFAELRQAGAVAEFARFYHGSLGRVGAAAHWYMSPEFFARVAALPSCGVFAVRRGAEVVSAALAVFHPSVSYYLLAGNGAERPAGASELLIHGLARACAARGSAALILGGGNSTDEHDTLLAFKRKFAPACELFHVGGAVYLPETFTALCDPVRDMRPAPGPYFLKYRLLAA